MRHAIFWHFVKGLLHSISNIFSVTNITNNYVTKIIILNNYNINIICMYARVLVYFKRIFSNALASFWNTLSEIDDYTRYTMNCINSLFWKDFIKSFSPFLLCGMFNVCKRNCISKIIMYYIKFALFKTPRRTLIIIKVPD